MRSTAGPRTGTYEEEFSPPYQGSSANPFSTGGGRGAAMAEDGRLVGINTRYTNTDRLRQSGALSQQQNDPRRRHTGTAVRPSTSPTGVFTPATGRLVKANGQGKQIIY